MPKTAEMSLPEYSTGSFPCESPQDFGVASDRSEVTGDDEENAEDRGSGGESKPTSDGDDNGGSLIQPGPVQKGSIDIEHLMAAL